MYTSGGAFRAPTGGGLLTIGDDFLVGPPAGACAWTEGATQIDSVPAPTVTGQQRTIYGWSISFTQWLVKESGPIFGKLGPIIGGLIRGQSMTTGNPAILQTYQRPVGQLPNDTSLLAIIWDPGQSDSPAIYDGTSAILPRPATVFNYALPQPVIVSAGEQVSIGIWMMPCLLSTGCLRFLQTPAWSITYEDAPTPRRR